MSAGLSAQKAYESAIKLPFPANMVMAPLSAGIALAAGLSNVARIKSAATGADFVTSGPQLMAVGDNPGGRERVQVTPLSSTNVSGPGNAITIGSINISGMSNADEIADTVQERLRGFADMQTEVSVLQL